MGNDVIRVDYEALGRIAERFGAEAESVGEMDGRVRQTMDALQNGGWEGEGSTAFFAEMNGTVLPSVTRLTNALEEAQKVTLEVVRVMQEAEEEAARPFRTPLDERPAFARNGSSAAPAGLPGFPPSPPPPASGDGAGEHGAVARNWLEQRWDDLQKQLWYEVADGADAVGLDNAARHMRHYLSNTGDTLTVSPEAMLRDMPDFQQKVQQTIQYDLTDAINKRIAAEYTGQPATFQVTTDWMGDYAQKNKSADWYYAMGGFSYAVGAEVTVTPGENDRPLVQVNYQVHVFDRYNWDPGKSVNIGPVHIPDATPGHLHQVGIAREYEVRGTSAIYSHNYEYTGMDSMPANVNITGDSRASERGRVVDDPTRNDDFSRRAGSRPSERQESVR
ncbi:MAG TPA: WXG100 family type VII secretion target [Anaerolineae bacterium]|nr:WXG100 family type VII secretion target [Anaerolineae bacterium]